MVLRFDKHEISKPTIDQNGYLHADARVTRAGVFVYHKPDGSTTRELRHPDDVFKADSMETLKNRPVTDGHPYPGKLDAKNTKQFAVGSLVKSPTKNDIYLDTRMMVTDQDAIDKIMREDSPVREISCGYECKMVKESGTYQGERYDERQTNIVYNHVAIVDKGRAGPQARLVLDAADGAVEGFEIALKEDSSSTKQENEKMKVVKIKRAALKTGTFKTDALSVEVDESAEQAIGIILDQLDSSVDHIRGLETKLDAATTKADTLKGEMDQLKIDAVIPPEKLAAMVADRADVLGVAAHIGVTDKLDDVDSDGIKKKIVLFKNPDLKADDLSSAGYVQGRYDSIIAGIKADNEGLTSLAALAAATSGTGQHGKLDEDDNGETLAPAAKFKQDTENLWMTKEDQAANV
jgi:hypothetical protein